MTEDEVRYDDQIPWPTAADGQGASLTRISSTHYGNDSTSWIAVAPSPGQVQAVNADLNQDGTVDYEALTFSEIFEEYGEHLTKGFKRAFIDYVRERARVNNIDIYSCAIELFRVYKNQNTKIKYLTADVFNKVLNAVHTLFPGHKNANFTHKSEIIHRMLEENILLSPLSTIRIVDGKRKMVYLLRDDNEAWEKVFNYPKMPTKIERIYGKSLSLVGGEIVY